MKHRSLSLSHILLLTMTWRLLRVMTRSTFLSLTMSSWGSPSRSSSRPSITFVPDEGFFGLCFFTYQICDSSDSCDTALVTVEVAPEFNYWYPDWSPGGDGCLNDGGEKPYMKRNAVDYLHM